jgi:hypothetical protein
MDESNKRTDIEPEFITIVEGPEPEFVSHEETWALSLLEGPEYIGVSRCQLRTYNGSAMVERCRQAWAEGRPVLLDYPNRFGLRKHAQVVAARHKEIEQGPLLLLWVRSPEPDEDEID